MVKKEKPKVDLTDDEIKVLVALIKLRLVKNKTKPFKCTGCPGDAGCC